MRNTKTGRFEATHNSSNTYEYNIWGNMLYRCNCPTSPAYELYGGRGVRVSEEWHSFEVFIKDMGERPTNLHSIDRINVDGNYCADNCKWATKKEQSRNKTNSRYLIVNGERIQVDDYCEANGISKAAIKNRFRRGWDNDRIISTPVRGHKKCL